jgi:two-component system, NarL family, response regulator DegU
MRKTRLLIIEDNHLLREGLVAILKRQKDIVPFAVSSDGESTILKIHKFKPGIILLDLDIRSQNSLHTVETLKKEFPEAKVVVMDLAPLQGDIHHYVKAGALGFVLKDTTLDDFLMTIRTVAGGTKVLPPRFQDTLFSKIVELAIKSKRITSTEPVRMTKAEKEVFVLISDGLSNNEIGRRLHTPTRIVKTHVENIMKKLTWHNHLEAANHNYADGALKTIVGNISMVRS